MVVAEKSRLDTASSVIRRDIGALVKVIERRVVKIDARIDAALATDPEKEEIQERLQSTPCVGPGVARTLIIDLPELGSLSRRQITSLVGLAPFAKDSGRKTGQGRIRAGRSAPRTALYLAAMNGARFNPGSQSNVRSTDRCRETAQGGLDRARPETADDPERDGAGRNELAGGDWLDVGTSQVVQASLSRAVGDLIPSARWGRWWL
jgi:hypothetical protein